MIEIAPSLLAAPFGDLSASVATVLTAGAQVIHVDIMDGQFVPPITFGSNMVTLAKSLGSPVVEAHLMTVSPERHLETFAEAGADRIIVHQEATPHLHRVLGRIKQLGILAGVAINPGTPASLLREVIEITDVILVMTVNPGWGGQPFIPKCLEKVREIADIINERGAATLIEVDGGVNDLTIPQCVTAGASLLVTGTALFAAQNVATRFRELQSIARNG